MGARKEIKYVFLYDIVSKVEEDDILDSLIINLDQIPLRLVPFGKRTMAKKRSTNVTTVGASAKWRILGTFAITLSGDFLPIRRNNFKESSLL